MRQVALRRRDERGVTIPVVALCLIVIMLAVALAIDTGRIAVRARDLQKIADLAALDGVRQLNGGTCTNTYQLASDPGPSTQYAHVLAEVRASATRNGFTPGAGNNNVLVLEMGTITDDTTTRKSTFTPLPDNCTAIPNSIRVTARDNVPYAFGVVAGFTTQNVSRSGVARRQGLGAFEIGASIATLDTASSAFLNRIIDRRICALSPTSCSVNISAVGYDGLAKTSISLGPIAVALGLGSPDQLAGTTVTAGRFFQATATAMGCTGTPPTMTCPSTGGADLQAGRTAIQALANAGGSAPVNLGKIFQGAVGGGPGAAGATISLLGLLNGTASAINGSNAVSVSGLSLGIPGITGASMDVAIVESPRYVWGPVGTSITTAQVTLTLRLTIDLTVQSATAAVPAVLGPLGVILTPAIAALPAVGAKGDVVITISGGGATGVLTSITCEGPNKGITVGVGTSAANVAVTSTPLQLVGLAGTPTVTVSGQNIVAPTGGGGLSFAYSEVTPPNEYYSPPKHVAGTALSLSATPLTATVTAGTLGSFNSTTTTNALGSLLGLVNAQLSPVLGRLGVDIGGADVTAQNIDRTGDSGYPPGPVCGLQAIGG